MIDRLIEYLYGLCDGYGYYYLQTGVPYYVILVTHSLSLLFFSIWSLLDRKAIIRKFVIVLLADYIVLILSSTVLFRSDDLKTGWNLIPFWTYSVIMNGKREFVLEVVLNVLVFIPIGFLIGLIAGAKPFRKTLFFCLFISVTIEMGQLIFNKGFAEIDDLIHNTLGGVVGFLFAWPIRRFFCTRPKHVISTHIKDCETER